MILPADAVQDKHKNWHVVIGDSSIIWSCHTDTVHRHGGRQAVARLGDTLHLSLTARDSNCLGADDTVGVWLCLEMIAAGVPGRYIFHYGEERGGLGSTPLTRDPEWRETLSQYRACIALDRMDRHDVITHQGWQRCCSDVFANSIADILAIEDHRLTYKPDDGGIYTDSAEYIDLIGECTNLSVGYFAQHSRGEWVDLQHVERLRDALIGADWSALVYARAAGEIDERDWGAAGGWGGHYRDDYTPRYADDDSRFLTAEEISWSRELAEHGYKWDDDPLSDDPINVERLKRRIALDQEYCYYCDNGGCVYCNHGSSPYGG